MFLFLNKICKERENFLISSIMDYYKIVLPIFWSYWLDFQLQACFILLWKFHKITVNITKFHLKEYNQQEINKFLFNKINKIIQTDGMHSNKVTNKLRINRLNCKEFKNPYKLFFHNQTLKFISLTDLFTSIFFLFTYFH